MGGGACQGDEGRGESAAAHYAQPARPRVHDRAVAPSRRRDNGTFTDVYIISGDPAIVVFKGEYWLFASHADGYWYSKDLAKWHFVRVPPDHKFQLLP